MIKLQQSQALTSHFESFWSIVVWNFCILSNVDLITFFSGLSGGVHYSGAKHNRTSPNIDREKDLSTNLELGELGQLTITNDNESSYDVSIFMKKKGFYLFLQCCQLIRFGNISFEIKKVNIFCFFTNLLREMNLVLLLLDHALSKNSHLIGNLVATPIL